MGYDWGKYSSKAGKILYEHWRSVIVCDWIATRIGGLFWPIFWTVLYVPVYVGTLKFYPIFRKFATFPVTEDTYHTLLKFPILSIDFIKYLGIQSYLNTALSLSWTSLPWTLLLSISPCCLEALPDNYFDHFRSNTSVSYKLIWGSFW